MVDRNSGELETPRKVQEPKVSALLHSEGAASAASEHEPENLNMKNATATRTSNDSTSDAGISGSIASRGVIAKITIAGAVAAALGLSACGAVAERATEQGVEQLIESSIDDELGDFDIDLDLSDGNFSIDTDDGSFSFGEDGTVVFDTDEGTFTGQVDATGIELNGDDGSVFDMDIGGDEESVSISVETDEGSFEASSALATLDDWPADVPRPIVELDEWVAGAVTGDELWLNTGGSVAATPQETVAAYVSMFAGAEVVEQDLGETEAVTITTPDYVINVMADVNSLRGGSSVSYTITSR